MELRISEDLNGVSKDRQRFFKEKKDVKRYIFSNENAEFRSHRFTFTLQHTDDSLKTFPKISKQQGRFND